MVKNKVLVFRPHILKMRRLSLSLSMFDVAQKINRAILAATGEHGRVSSASVCGWENGTSDPTAKSLGLWASVLDLSVDDCFEVVETGAYSFTRKGGRPRE